MRATRSSPKNIIYKNVEESLKMINQKLMGTFTKIIAINTTEEYFFIEIHSAEKPVYRYTFIDSIKIRNVTNKNTSPCELLFQKKYVNLNCSINFKDKSDNRFYSLDFNDNLTINLKKKISFVKVLN